MACYSKPRTIPAFVTPMAAQTVKGLPEGEEWLYELKLDGYRALLLKRGKQIEVRSRNNKDLTRMFHNIASAGLRLKSEQVVLDGEIVALDQDGRPSFQALQHRGSYPEHQIVFYAFDVLHLDGHDLLGAPLTPRRARLPEIVGQNATLRLSQELPGTPAEIVAFIPVVHRSGPPVGP